MSKSQYNLAPPSPTTLAPVLSTAPTNPMATIATENNAIYSLGSQQRWGEKKENK